MTNGAPSGAPHFIRSRYLWLNVYASAFPVPHGTEISQDRATPVPCLNLICSSAAKQEQALFVQMISILLCYNGSETVCSKTKIRITASNVIIANFNQLYHSICSERNCDATALMTTPAGSFSSAPRYWICSISSATGAEAFLGDPTLLTKRPLCQPAIDILLNEHRPGLRPVFIPHYQYICHLIAPLEPYRKTHRKLP